MAKRRNVLIGVGGMIAIAGCTDELEEPEEEEEPQEQEDETESEEEEEIQEEESEEIQEEEPEEEEEAEEEQEDTEPEEEEEENEEPTQEELFEQAIERVEEEYRLAFEAFGEASDHEDSTFIHVLPSDEFGNDEVNSANEHTTNAEDISWDEVRDIADTDEQREIEREYRRYGDIILEMGRVQREIHRSFGVLNAPEEDTQYDIDELDSARKRHDEIADELEDFEMYMEEIETNHEQQEWQLNQLERTFDGVEALEGALEPDLLTPTQLRFARDEFREVRDELEDTESAPPEDITDEEFLELVEDWYEATDDALREIAT